MLRRAVLKAALKTIPALGLLTACGKSGKIRLALNWKPEPEFGGFYAARFDSHSLDVEILPGGAGTPTVQMVGAGSAEFGIVEADELVLARSKGNPVVSLFTVYQHSPLGIMVHAERNLSSIGDVLKEGTLAVEQGLPFVRLLEKQYGFEHVRVVPSPGGDLTAFFADPKFAQQCFITSEPLAARRKGVAVKVFPVSDIGYDPYTNVLATSEETLRKNPAMVKSMVEAVRQGWRAYLDDPKATNEKMHQMNPSMDADTFAEVAEAQKPFIEDPSKSGLGSMTNARWDTLVGQLKELGYIPAAMPAEECFRLL
jgi:NitT/TauT family transport system substrate-binding protein